MKSSPRHRTILGALALAALLGAGPAVAGPGRHPGYGHGPEGGLGGPLMGALARLDLSDDQKTQIKAILDDEKPKVGPLFEQTRASRRALYEAESAATFDEAGVRAAAQAAAGAEADLAVAKARLNSRVRSVLTADQQQKLDTLRQQFLQKMDQRGPGARGAWHHRPAGDAPPDDPGGANE